MALSLLTRQQHISFKINLYIIISDINKIIVGLAIKYKDCERSWCNEDFLYILDILAK